MPPTTAPPATCSRRRFVRSRPSWTCRRSFRRRCWQRPSTPQPTRSCPELDRTDIPLITIDPAGSKDLDQALHIERRGDGYRVHYAIADVAAFVEPGWSDRRRGAPSWPDACMRPSTGSRCTHRSCPRAPRACCPIRCVPRCCGRSTSTRPARASRSTSSGRSCARAPQLDYAGAQAALDDGSADEVLLLLKEVGELRWARERERGGISLPLPEQEIVVDDGRWSLTYRNLLPVEEWNAQISLLTGMGAAEIMLYGEEGIVRTLPPAPDWALAKLRRTAAALKIDWHPDIDYPDFVRTLDPNTPDRCRDAQRVHGAAARCWLRRLRRGSARAHRACRPGQRVRPRHRAAAAARGPVRR